MAQTTFQRREAGRLGGHMRARTTTREQRARESQRASVTRWILARLGKPDPTPSASPFDEPYRVFTPRR